MSDITGNERNKLKARAEKLQITIDGLFNTVEEAIKQEEIAETHVKDLEKRQKMLANRNDKEMQRQLKNALDQAKLETERSHRDRQSLENKLNWYVKELGFVKDMLEPHPSLSKIGKQMAMVQQIINKEVRALNITKGTDEKPVKAIGTFETGYRRDLEFEHLVGGKVPGEQYRFSFGIDDTNQEKLNYLLAYIKLFEELDIPYGLTSKANQFVLLFKQPKDQEKIDIINSLTPNMIQEKFREAFSSKEQIQDRITKELIRIRELALLATLKNLIERNKIMDVKVELSATRLDAKHRKQIPGAHIKLSGNASSLENIAALAKINSLSLLTHKNGSEMFIQLSKQAKHNPPKMSQLVTDFGAVFPSSLTRPQEKMPKTKPRYQQDPNKKTPKWKQIRRAKALLMAEKAARNAETPDKSQTPAPEFDSSSEESGLDLSTGKLDDGTFIHMKKDKQKPKA